MGLHNDTFSAKYLNINKGKICLYQDGKITESTHLTGHLVKITLHNDERFGTKLYLHIVDEKDYFKCQMFLNSGYAFAFLMQMENIDLAQPITLIPKYSEEDNKKSASLFINQRGGALKWKYTKKDMGALPALAPCKIKNPQSPGLIDGYDNTARMEYLMDVIFRVIVPNIQRLPNPYPNHPAYSGNMGNHVAEQYFNPAEHPANTHNVIAGPPSDITDPVDDLPF